MTNLLNKIKTRNLIQLVKELPDGAFFKGKLHNMFLYFFDLKIEEFKNQGMIIAALINRICTENDLGFYAKEFFYQYTNSKFGNESFI